MSERGFASQVRRKLGRCRRCMVLTALLMGTSIAGALALPEPGNILLRTLLYASALAFGLLGVLHLCAALLRELIRPLHEGGGGCNCGPPRRRRV